ncbi:MAG: monofunctional biosynthetic peptidoglycan transglycosylase [Pseudomonadota bacterium]
MTPLAPKRSSTRAKTPGARKTRGIAARDLSGEVKKSARRNAKPPVVRVDPKVKPPRRWLKRLVVWSLATVVLISLFPIFLGLAYWPSFAKPVSTLMVADMVRGQSPKRDWVALEDISPVVWQSVISSEDGQFCAHHGVDWKEVEGVVDDLLEGESPRGASTLAMQTAKNLFLWPQRSYIRKGLEVPLALYIDWLWGKKRLMEVYLNIAEWGPNIYGIEAAARHHFNRSAGKLSRRQAALLAVTLPNPKLRNPAKPKRGLNRLARLNERRARQSGAYVKCLR